MAEYTHYCNHCKSFLEDNDIWHTYEEETGFHTSGCKWCGSEDITETQPCPICGQATTEDFCNNCYEKIRVGLNALQEEMGADRSDFEDIISNHFGW